jgi:hypothetical protein
MVPTDDKVNLRGIVPTEGSRPIRLGDAMIIQENPFFVPPDEFLRELRERPGPG